MEMTKIPVHVETREKLKKYGNKGDTYDQIIQKLMNRGKNEEASKP